MSRAQIIINTGGLRDQHGKTLGVCKVGQSKVHVIKLRSQTEQESGKLLLVVHANAMILKHQVKARVLLEGIQELMVSMGLNEMCKVSLVVTHVMVPSTLNDSLQSACAKVQLNFGKHDEPLLNNFEGKGNKTQVTLQSCNCEGCSGWQEPERKDFKFMSRNYTSWLIPPKTMEQVGAVDFDQCAEGRPYSFSVELDAVAEPAATFEMDGEARLPYDAERHLKEIEELVDFSRVPPRLMRWFKKLISTFAHCFATKDWHSKTIRDRRVAIRLVVNEEKLPKTNLYPADKVSAGLISDMFDQMIATGMAAPADPQQIVHFSPVYLRLSSSSDFDRVRRDPSFKPNMRLISNFQGLNMALKGNLPSYLPSLKHSVLSAGGAKFAGTSDLSKFFRAFPLHPDSIKYTNIISPTGQVISCLVSLEGLAPLPYLTHAHIVDSYVFSMPRKEDIEEALELTRKGAKMARNLDDIANLLRRPDDGALPKTRSKPYVPPSEVSKVVPQDRRLEKIRTETAKYLPNPKVLPK